MKSNTADDRPLLDVCITKNYDEQGVLAGARLKVFPGDVIMLRGRNGFGKSTFINIAGGLMPPTQGFVFWGNQCVYMVREGSCPFGSCSECDKAKGIDLSAVPILNADNLRGEHISFVLQETNLVENFTVFDNVSLPLIVSGRKVDRQSVHYFLEMVGLSKKMHIEAGDLSGGQRQRVNIARAFAADPKIIFADEPFSHVDTETKKDIWSVICQQKVENPDFSMDIL